jgi:hypothetical protein
LYINNIIHTVPNSKVFTYADDTTLIVAADTEQELTTLAVRVTTPDQILPPQQLGTKPHKNPIHNLLPETPQPAF